MGDCAQLSCNVCKMVLNTTYPPPKNNIAYRIPSVILELQLQSVTDPTVFSYIFTVHIRMDVSENRGTPKSSILTGFSIINHPFWVPLFLETPIYIQSCIIRPTNPPSWPKASCGALGIYGDSIYGGTGESSLRSGPSGCFRARGGTHWLGRWGSGLPCERCDSRRLSLSCFDERY